MSIKLSIILYFLSFLFGPVQQKEQKCHIVSDSREKVIASIKKDYGCREYSLYIPELLKEFSTVPYGAGGSGCGSSQTLVNVKTMDCMTFVENIWALAFTRHIISRLPEFPGDDDIFSIYIQNLNAIRYYNGMNNRNEDRIQYLTSAMIQLEKAGVLENALKIEGKALQKPIHYVTGNRAKFGGFSDWTFLQSKESEMSQYTYFHISKEDIPRYASIAKNGDIVGLATTVSGLDVSHCGIITVDKGNVYMTHASSVKKQVCIAQDLESYLKTRTTISGIFVYRPVFPEQLPFLVSN